MWLNRTQIIVIGLENIASEQKHSHYNKKSSKSHFIRPNCEN